MAANLSFTQFFTAVKPLYGVKRITLISGSSILLYRKAYIKQKNEKAIVHKTNVTPNKNEIFAFVFAGGCLLK